MTAIYIVRRKAQSYSVGVNILCSWFIMVPAECLYSATASFNFVDGHYQYHTKTSHSMEGLCVCVCTRTGIFHEYSKNELVDRNSQFPGVPAGNRTVTDTQTDKLTSPGR